MPLYLWKLTCPNAGMNSAAAPSGSYDTFVVVAESAATAREFVAKHGCGTECKRHSFLIPVRDHKRCVWLDRQKTDCTRIGLAEAKLVAGVVCSSFWSG